MQSASEHVSLAVVIPTLGRATLRDTLDSVVPQMLPGDDLIVVADGAGDWKSTSTIWAEAKPPIGVRQYLARTPPGKGCNGYMQRTFGMRLAHTSHIAFMDDDDIYVEGALEAIRGYAEPEIPTIFKMMYGSETYAHRPGDCIWKTEEVVYGNVGTPMFVVPNRWDSLGRWKACQEFDGKPCGGDFTFISETIDKSGGVKWVDHVIALIRPKGRQSEGSPSTSSI